MRSPRSNPRATLRILRNVVLFVAAYSLCTYLLVDTQPTNVVGGIANVRATSLSYKVSGISHDTEVVYTDSETTTDSRVVSEPTQFTVPVDMLVSDTTVVLIAVNGVTNPDDIECSILINGMSTVTETIRTDSSVVCAVTQK